jgi:predicted dehydrogenase
MLQQHPADIFSICTPPGRRVEIIKKIIDMASPRLIFCEKPLANSLAEALKLAALLEKTHCTLVPNLSRRWNSGTYRVLDVIRRAVYGELQKINIRYTRGIFNTGSHMFDLIRLYAGDVRRVQALGRVLTSSDADQDPSFSFAFSTAGGAAGFAEAFDDHQYYMFEMDLYFARGKLEVRHSGDEIGCYGTGPHPLFPEFASLRQDRVEKGFLAESSLANAYDHIVRVLDGREDPLCTVADGLFPLYVAHALLRSYNNNGSKEEVAVKNYE